MSGAPDAAARPGSSPSSLRSASEALLGGLLGSPRGGRQAAAAAAAADEEQPLLGSSPGQAAALRSPGPDERRPWPQLRGSSVSTRPFTPGLLAQELASQDDGWELDHDSASSPIPADRSSPGRGATHGDGSGSLDAAAGAAAAAAACGKLGGSGGEAAAAGHHHTHPRRRWRHARAMFAGLVDCTIALPLQTSFAAIIFRVGCRGWVIGTACFRMNATLHAMQPCTPASLRVHVTSSMHAHCPSMPSDLMHAQCPLITSNTMHASDNMHACNAHACLLPCMPLHPSGPLLPPPARLAR